MKFKLREDIINTVIDPVGDYLRKLGISKVNSFIGKPEEEDQESWRLLTNITKSMDMLKKHIELNSKIFLQVDSDTDGYTSAAIMYMFIKHLNSDADIHFNIHPDKEHGLVISDLKQDYGLIIIPDAGSNQEELKTLPTTTDILIIDHHIADVDISQDNIVVLNNQTSPLFSNSSLSGAGMVYKFAQAYSETHLNNEYYKEFLDLAAIGIVSDSMDSRNLDNNYIIYHGLNNINNKMIKALLEARAFSVSSVEKPTKIDIAFYVAPIINGLIRFGTMEEKRDFFTALVTNNSSEIFKRVSRGVEKEETLYEKVARESASVKVKQDNSIKKIVPLLQERIESENMQDNKIIICKISKTNPDEVPKTITGLVAMKLSAHYKKPVLVLRPVFIDGKTTYAGSGRASAVDGFTSFKDFLVDSTLVDYAAGHNLAFGSSIPEENIPALIEYANKELADVDFGSSTVEVDFMLKSASESLVYEFGSVNYIYGNGIPQPKFLFDLTISASQFSIQGANQSTLKVRVGGLDFIKFWAKEEIKDILKIKSTGKVRIVGRPQINEWRGVKNPQIIIEYLEVLEEEASLF